MESIITRTLYISLILSPPKFWRCRSPVAHNHHGPADDRPTTPQPLGIPPIPQAQARGKPTEKGSSLCRVWVLRLAHLTLGSSNLNLVAQSSGQEKTGCRWMSCPSPVMRSLVPSLTPLLGPGVPFVEAQSLQEFGWIPDHRPRPPLHPNCRDMLESAPLACRVPGKLSPGLCSECYGQSSPEYPVE